MVNTQATLHKSSILMQGLETVIEQRFTTA